MSELRWILLLFGLIVVVAVYFVGRRRGDDGEGSVVLRHEPQLGDAVDPVDEQPTDTDAPSTDMSQDAEIPDDPWENSTPETQSDFVWSERETEELPGAEAPLDENRKVVSLRVAAREPQGFAGADVLRILQDEDLRHGKYEIFHRLYKNDENAFTFSVASMMEPGSFDLAVVDTIRIPGLSFFLVLPGPQEASVAFSEMLATARRVADRLAGELQDHSGSTLSAQRASNLREEVINYEYQAGLRHRSQPH